MMDKKPSSELHLVKYLVLVPFVAAMALTFNIAGADNTVSAEPVESTEPGTHSAAAILNSSGSVLTVADAVSDTIPGADTGKTPLPDKVVIGHPSPDRSAESNQKEQETSPMPPDKVVTGYPSPKVNRSNKNEAAASEVVHVGYFELDPSDEDWETMKDTLPPAVFEMMEATHKRKTDSDIKQEAPLVIVDGEPSATGLNGIEADDIASISVLKDDQAISLYGKKGKNGVMLITSKKNAAETLNQSEVSEDEKKTVPRIKLRSDNGLENALYVVDGKITSAEEIEKISPDDIFSIDVLKGESATDKYGKKGESGVIQITTKE